MGKEGILCVNRSSEMCHLCVSKNGPVHSFTFHLFFHFNQSQCFSPIPCWFPCIVPRADLAGVHGVIPSNTYSAASSCWLLPSAPCSKRLLLSSSPHTPFTLGPRAAGIIWSQLNKGRKKTQTNTPLSLCASKIQPGEKPKNKKPQILRNWLGKQFFRKRYQNQDCLNQVTRVSRWLIWTFFTPHTPKCLLQSWGKSK